MNTRTYADEALMNAPHASFLPLPADEAIEPFRVAGTMAVRSLVRELLAARALVALFAADDPDLFIVTRILSLEADSLELEFDGDADRRRALLEAPYLTVVGAPGSVKIQFRLQNVETVQVPVKSGRPGNLLLTAGVPAEGWRVQRRNAFRVQPPVEDRATVFLRLPAKAEQACALTDISVGGVALTWAAGDPPALGTRLRHCRIEAEGIVPIPCDLRVVRVDAADGGERPAVSCEFESMPHTVARFAQLYVMDIEKRARTTMQRVQASQRA
jgi:c-di-GMP-binding flagellar brake protein YcgR